jgi:probable HAF family extracellular repeat protein
MSKTLGFLVLLGAVGRLSSATFYTAIDIGSLTGGATVPFAINSSGQVAGYSVDPSGAPRAFLYTGGAMQNLGALIGGLESAASGVNDLGAAVGTFKLGSGFRHAFLYSGGVAADLTPFHPANSGAVAINNSGQIAGTIDTAGAIRAFLYSGGAISLLPSFGGTETSSGGVNAAGQVTGEVPIASGPRSTTPARLRDTPLRSVFPPITRFYTRAAP